MAALTQATQKAPAQKAQTQTTQTTGQTQQNLVGNQAVAGKVAGATTSTPPALPTSMRGQIGKVTYYQSRNDDFKKRHSTPPPDYYMNYGDKYARRFTTKLKPTLSAAGQAWLDRAFVLLQQAMENKLDASPAKYDALEKDAGAFKSFAYGTHPRAYLDAGLSKLPPGDLLKIGTTPDIGDLLTMDGVSQVIETGMELVPQWGGQALDKAKEVGGDALDTAKKYGGKAVDTAKEVGSDVWDWATDW